MARFHNIDGNRIQFTVEEEASRDAEEAAEAAAEPGRRAKIDLVKTESAGAIARKLEDVIDNIVNGTPLPLTTKKWASGRKTKRSKL